MVAWTTSLADGTPLADVSLELSEAGITGGTDADGLAAPRAHRPAGEPVGGAPGRRHGHPPALDLLLGRRRLGGQPTVWRPDLVCLRRPPDVPPGRGGAPQGLAAPLRPGAHRRHRPGRPGRRRARLLRHGSHGQRHRQRERHGGRPGRLRLCVHRAGEQQPGLRQHPDLGAERGRREQPELLPPVPDPGVPPPRIRGDGTQRDHRPLLPARGRRRGRVRPVLRRRVRCPTPTPRGRSTPIPAAMRPQAGTSSPSASGSRGGAGAATAPT